MSSQAPSLGVAGLQTGTRGSERASGLQVGSAMEPGSHLQPPATSQMLAQADGCWQPGQPAGHWGNTGSTALPGQSPAVLEHSAVGRAAEGSQDAAAAISLHRDTAMRASLLSALQEPDTASGQAGPWHLSPSCTSSNRCGRACGAHMSMSSQSWSGVKHWGMRLPAMGICGGSCRCMQYAPRAHHAAMSCITRVSSCRACLTRWVPAAAQRRQEEMRCECAPPQAGTSHQ